MQFNGEVKINVFASIFNSKCKIIFSHFMQFYDLQILVKFSFKIKNTFTL